MLLVNGKTNSEKTELIIMGKWGQNIGDERKGYGRVRQNFRLNFTASIARRINWNCLRCSQSETVIHTIDSNATAISKCNFSSGRKHILRHEEGNNWSNNSTHNEVWYTKEHNIPGYPMGILGQAPGFGFWSDSQWQFSLRLPYRNK